MVEFRHTRRTENSLRLMSWVDPVCDCDFCDPDRVRR